MAVAVNLNRPNEKAKTAEIYYYKELLKTIDLTKAKAEKLNFPEAPEVVIEATKEGIFFSTSNCKDKICVNSGKLSLIGETAACLPNGILIKLN